MKSANTCIGTNCHVRHRRATPVTLTQKEPLHMSRKNSHSKMHTHFLSCVHIHSEHSMRVRTGRIRSLQMGDLMFLTVSFRSRVPLSKQDAPTAFKEICAKGNVPETRLKRKYTRNKSKHRHYQALQVSTVTEDESCYPQTHPYQTDLLNLIRGILCGWLQLERPCTDRPWSKLYHFNISVLLSESQRSSCYTMNPVSSL